MQAVKEFQISFFNFETISINSALQSLQDRHVDFRPDSYPFLQNLNWNYPNAKVEAGLPLYSPFLKLVFRSSGDLTFIQSSKSFSEQSTSIVISALGCCSSLNVDNVADITKYMSIIGVCSRNADNSAEVDGALTPNN
jgi:hypothetical protein